MICGARFEEIEEPTMREIRCLDKLIDELAKDTAPVKISARSPARCGPAREGLMARGKIPA